MKNKKLTTYQMAVTALMAAALCVLGPLSVPIGAIPISLSNFVICLTAWLLGPKFGTLSVVIYLALGAIGIPVFSGYGAGLAKLAGPTGGYLVGYLLLAFIGGLFIEKSKGQPVISGIGLVLGDAACYVLGGHQGNDNNAFSLGTAATEINVMNGETAAAAMYARRLVKEEKAGEDLQPTIDKMNALIQDYAKKSSPKFCAKAGLTDEIVDMNDIRPYIQAFANACYQNPESICPVHQMLLPRVIRDYDALNAQ